MVAEREHELELAVPATTGTDTSAIVLLGFGLGFFEHHLISLLPLLQI